MKSMVRVDYHLRKDQKQALEYLAKQMSNRERVTVAALIRKAVDDLIEAQPKG
jgi:hypothetical protein